MRTESRVWLLFLSLIALFLFTACSKRAAGWDPESGLIIKPSGNADIPAVIREIETSFPQQIMNGSGLAGAMGGINLKAHRAGEYYLRLPLPQITDGQIPVYYGLETKPQIALLESRLQEQNDGNVFISLQLQADKGQEISIEWSSVILITQEPAIYNPALPQDFISATACVQTKDPRISELSEQLWPATNSIKDYAIQIQQFILQMESRKQPMSLDALGILNSGYNTICTANANLACALMRAKQVPCRIMATLPTISRRFEMHRIVEYYDQGTWIPFDPSMVYADIPLQPWQNIIMVKNNINDENVAMKPRPGSMLGCPFGQEIEFIRPGLNLFGPSFFWTIAAPLAEFEVSEEVVSLTIEQWQNFLQTGILSKAQILASSAHNFEQYLEVFETED